ncbi:stalk domain-containing protein [Peptococcus simiae]|uniref:Stalk domain-containing protein n=1 Tax=Peptococcus simiae TaxID=1643805 RepID=A0ABW9GXY6_9FIRM
MLKKRIMALMAGALCLTAWSLATAEPAQAQVVRSEPIAPGVVEEMHHWQNARIGVWRCDLTNPNTDLRLVAGAGEYTRRATVGQMSARTNAVAMMNGDYFNMALQGSPIGPSIVNGRLQSSPAVIIGLYSLGIDAGGTAHIEAMTFNGGVKAADGASFPLDGLNKTYYWHDPSGQESHTDTIQMYNDFWGSASRGHATNTEVLIGPDGTVEQISYGKNLPYPVPDGKIILQANGQGELFVKKHLKIDQKAQVWAGVQPDRQWKFLVGGHALLVNDGQLVPYTKDINVLGGVRARTAAGISADGKTVYFACAEGRTSRSAGLSLGQLSRFMQALGADKAVNLDGGGSSTLVSRPLGSFNRQVAIAPEGFGAQRAVVNGIGIFNETPEGPVVAGKLSGPSRLVQGESGQFGLASAWDANYHPKATQGLALTYTDGGQNGIWDGPWFVALQPGTVSVKALADGRELAQKDLVIQGPEAVSGIRIQLDKFMVQPGDFVNARVFAKTLDGRSIELSPRVINWQLEGFTGDITGEYGAFGINQLNNLANGKIKATFGNHTAEAYLGNPAYRLLDLGIGQSQYWLDGQAHQLDVAPYIHEGRTLVPLRLIAEAYGGEVTWSDERREVEVALGQTRIILPVDENRVTVNGDSRPIDVSPQIRNGRTFVPIRFIAETVGMQVEYNDQSRTVSIIAPKE